MPEEDAKMEDLTGDNKPAFGNDDQPIGKSSGMGTSMADAYPPGMSEEDFNKPDEKPIGKSSGPGSSMADAYPPGMTEEDVIAQSKPSGNDEQPIGKSSGMGTSMADAYPPGMSEE